MLENSFTNTPSVSLPELFFREPSCFSHSVARKFWNLSSLASREGVSKVGVTNPGVCTKAGASVTSLHHTFDSKEFFFPFKACFLYHDVLLCDSVKHVLLIQSSPFTTFSGSSSFPLDIFPKVTL